MIQHILVLSTTSLSMRAEVFGWSAEKMTGKIPVTKPIGLVSSGLSGEDVAYPTVLHAISDGWILMAPPIERTNRCAIGSSEIHYEWWLQKFVASETEYV